MTIISRPFKILFFSGTEEYDHLVSVSELAGVLCSSKTMGFRIIQDGSEWFVIRIGIKGEIIGDCVIVIYKGAVNILYIYVTIENKFNTSRCEDIVCFIYRPIDVDWGGLSLIGAIIICHDDGSNLDLINGCWIEIYQSW